MKKILYKQSGCKRIVLGFFFISFISSAIFAQIAEKQYPLEPFDYGQVKLLDGEQLTQLNSDKEFYLNISNDDLLKGFRQRAGLSAPGVGLTGWYGSDTFHVFGQLLAGYARMYAATGDIRCLTKVNYLIDEWAKTIRSDGYFYYTNNPNAKHYVYEKMVGGLVDCYLFCNNQKAINCLSTITDWAIANLDSTRVYGQNIDKYNGEWYTLSENLYRAYLATGVEKYKTFAKVWEYTEFWDIIRANGNPFLKKSPLHAYSHLNTFCSAAAAYRVKDDVKYLETAISGYNFFRDKQCYVTGGFGADEKLVDPTEITAILKTSTNSFEVQCSTWACFKLGKSLISFTGNGAYGNWIEQLMINGVGANIPMTSDGHNYHYANYNPGGATKTNLNDGWWCCTGTRPQAVADFQNLIYFHNENDLFVNLFVHSSLVWKGLDITQETTFPNENKTTIKFSGNNNNTPFTLGFRKAEWFAKVPVVKVNGQIVIVSESNGWYIFNKAWTNGDVLEIELPMDFKISKLPDGEDYPAAIKYGPVTMAVQLSDAYPIDVLTATKTPIVNTPLNFSIEGHPNWVLRPYYKIVADDPYYIYLDPESATKISDNAIKKQGTWTLYSCWASNIVGNSVEVTFTGTGIKWNGFKYNDAGKSIVKIDGNIVDTVDQYSSVRDSPFLWEKNGLEYGTHTFLMTISNLKNPSSIGTWVNYTEFRTILQTNTDVVKTKEDNSITLMNGKICFDNSYLGKLIRVNIYNFVGQILYTQLLRVSTNEYEIPKLSGSYIISIFNENNEKIFTNKSFQI